MLTKKEFQEHAETLYDFCGYPAVKYKVMRSFLDAMCQDTICRDAVQHDTKSLDMRYQNNTLSALREEFLKSDIVEEMYQTQDINGGWGRLLSKDYSVKAKIPTSSVGIERCLYIGLTIEDRDILFMASEYLQELILGTGSEGVFEKNERANPWQKAIACNLLEAITPYHPQCNETYYQWLYIANRAYEEGEYSFEKDRAAQHEVFLTREDRLVPMQSELLLKRRQEVPDSLEDAMLRHLGRMAYEKGYFWDKTPDKLPENFVYKQTRRWFKTFHYINQFRGSSIYLKNSVEWLLENARVDGLWDWGPQVNDPWGYFGYFSCNRHYKHNRVVDCTIEVLNFLKAYFENNNKFYDS